MRSRSGASCAAWALALSALRSRRMRRGPPDASSTPALARVAKSEGWIRRRRSTSRRPGVCWGMPDSTTQLTDAPGAGPQRCPAGTGPTRRVPPTSYGPRGLRRGRLDMPPPGRWDDPAERPVQVVHVAGGDPPGATVGVSSRPGPGRPKAPDQQVPWIGGRPKRATSWPPQVCDHSCDCRLGKASRPPRAPPEKGSDLARKVAQSNFLGQPFEPIKEVALRPQSSERGIVRNLPCARATTRARNRPPIPVSGSAVGGQATSRNPVPIHLVSPRVAQRRLQGESL